MNYRSPGNFTAFYKFGLLIFEWEIEVKELRGFSFVRVLCTRIWTRLRTKEVNH
jgi:hypothetical protein